MKKTLHLISMTSLAKRLGLTPQAIRARREAGTIPKEDAIADGRIPFWLDSSIRDIEPGARRAGRKPGK